MEFEGETYEFRFWNEDLGGSFQLPYFGVYKVLPPVHFLGKTIPQYEEIKVAWTESDRVQACWGVLENLWLDKTQKEKNDKLLTEFLNGE